MKMDDSNSMELVGLKEAATKLKLSPTALSNLRNRDKSFPLPCETPKSGPIWRAEDIFKYGLRTGRLTEDEFYIPAMWGPSKTIAIVGRAKVGKSFIVSMFADKTIHYRNAFSSGGGDKTACSVKNVFIDTNDDFMSFVEFHSSFHTDFKDVHDYEDLCSDAEFMNGTQVSLENTEKLPRFIENIERLVRRILEAEEQYKKQFPDKKAKKSQNTIEVYCKPSDFCRTIMQQASLKRLEVIDTPGVSGNVEFVKISKADLYVFLLNDANTDEAKTLEKIVEEIKPYIATSNACFLYRSSSGFITTKEKFEKEQKKVEKNMQQFEDLFVHLRGSIISRAMDVLYPAKTCICFPPMDPEDLSPPEELFREKFTDKIIRAFSGDTEKLLREEFDKVLNGNRDETFEYVKQILGNIPSHDHCAKPISYLPNFIKENHDRVKSNDNRRIVNNVAAGYRTEKHFLYKYFQDFTQEKCPEIWQQHTIRYLYHMLSQGVTRDCGLGIGIYHTEDSPALTMIAAESVLAEQVLNEIFNNPEKSRSGNYRNALRNNGITSKTWEKVFCSDNSLMTKKLQLIVSCLNHIPTVSLYELVFCRYIGGLRKITEYSILREFFQTDSDCENFVASLNF
ncbi:hypothetical protein BC351_33175 [Paenibacillus ferrarius]|uniref:Uncharacterized protein n=1 Tax=Paenibacillus ferrarius TaxID=1469647 RepID=A0A1V4HEP3_9BACL|nr:hypothetical protein [Paenibacillus ferrarius]OPH52187.1 hypothetical protein BC351_33175 [Paenibacillus ferrarius]